MFPRSQSSTPGWPQWAARGALALVLAWNLQAALAFILAPDAHAPGFEVSGVPGRAVVQGFGVLFLMWNVPYAAALVQPVRQIVPFACAVVAQFIGLAGETWMLTTLPPGHAALRATGLRFIAFDGAGLVLLAVAFALVVRFRRTAG
jgi:hypothetical protein